VRRCGLVSSGSCYGPVAGSFQQGNELSGSVEGGEFLDYLSDSLLRRILLLGIFFFCFV
jgi:hypothetical protein